LGGHSRDRDRAVTVDRPEEPAEEQAEPAADCLDRVCQELIRSVRRWNGTPWAGSKTDQQSKLAEPNEVDRAARKSPRATW
jgi:hypothetical protein